MGYLLAALAGLFVWVKSRPASASTPTRSAYDALSTNDLMTMAMQPSTTNLQVLQQMAASLDSRANAGDTTARVDAVLVRAKFSTLQAGQTFLPPS